MNKNKFIDSPYFVFAAGGFLGAVFFIYFYGSAILNFTYTDWLMTGGDLSQHYTGWRLFRNSAWHFPLGLMDNIVHPFKVSVIYTDSIPLFALVFKVFSPLLPQNFQYFGLFGIMCYMAQGGIAALIIKKLGGSISQSIICSFLFIISSIMMWRMYDHTALAAHCIILLCILICLYYNSWSFKKQIISWACLLPLSAALHLYFVPMVTVFMVSCLIYEYFATKKIKEQLIVFSVALIALFVLMFCLGAFHFVQGVNTWNALELGFYSANLNSFINPQGVSRFINDMPLATNGQFEGNAYLGLGIILAIIGISIWIVICMIKKNNKSDLKANSKIKIYPFVIGIIVFFLLFSLSPTITLNQHTLFTYPVPGFIKSLWSIFRATGRMTWPIVYIVTTICLWWIINRFSKKISIAILCALLLIQCLDLWPSFTNKGIFFKTEHKFQSELYSPVWKNIANDHKHIFFVDDSFIMKDSLFSFLDLAANNNMTVNNAYLARTNSVLIKENREKRSSYLMSNTVYIFPDERLAFSFIESGMNFYRIDGIVIGIHSNMEYLKSYALFVD